MHTLTFEEIVARIGTLEGDEPRIVLSGNAATPHTLVTALTQALDACRVFQLNAQCPFGDHPGIICETPFVGPGMRRDPQLDYLPMRLSLVPRLFDTVRPPDAVLLHTSMPRDGKVSLGIDVSVLPAAMEQARARGGLVLAQMNPRMPYTFGASEIALESMDGVIEVDEPLFSPGSTRSEEAATAIGERIATFAADGTTLQLGIGLIPTVAARLMLDRRGLRVWSEMISDGVMDLHRAGALDPDVPVFTSFLIGSPELYEWADGNEQLQMVRTETVNDPARIAAHPCMLSVNTAMQVDLFAQANAGFVDGCIHSGFGGQPDFVSGALHSPRWSRRRGPPRLARQDRLVHGGARPAQSGDVLPALGDRQRTRMRRALRSFAARAGSADHRAGGRSSCTRHPERCGSRPRTATRLRLITNARVRPRRRRQRSRAAH